MFVVASDLILLLLFFLRCCCCKILLSSYYYRFTSIGKYCALALVQLLAYCCLLICNVFVASLLKLLLLVLLFYAVVVVGCRSDVASERRWRMDKAMCPPMELQSENAIILFAACVMCFKQIIFVPFYYQAMWCTCLWNLQGQRRGSDALRKTYVE